jgi:protocatechuate 3,4-dioxygenase beta subunit
MNALPAPGLPRRTVAAALVAMPALWLGARAQPTASRLATPSQTEGPFYLDYRGGQPAWVDGTVTDLGGRPLRGAQVEIWQCDQNGHYHHPGDGDRADAAFQGFGRVTVGEDGSYRFRTIRPVPYSGRTPHVHVKVKLGTRELLTTQLYVAGDPGNARDYLWRNLPQAAREAVTVPFERGPDGLQARFPIAIAA